MVAPLVLSILLGMLSDRGGLATCVSDLVAQLGNEDFAVREAASKSLRDLGLIALPQLIKAGTNQDPEVAGRAAQLVAVLRPKACPLVLELKAEPKIDFKCVRFSADGKLVAACGESGLCVWETATGKEVKRFPLKGYTTSSLEFAPGGALVWVGGNGVGNGGTILRVDLKTEKVELFAHELPTHVGDLRVTGDGKRVVVAARRQVCVLNATTGEVVHTIRVTPHRINQLALGADGKTAVAVCSDRSIALIDYANGKLLREWQVPAVGAPKALLVGDVLCASWRSDGSTLAGCLSDQHLGGPIQIWEADGRFQKQLTIERHDVNRVSFVRADRLLLTSATESRRIEEGGRAKWVTTDCLGVWNPATGKLVARIDLGRIWVNDLAVSESRGLCALCTSTGTVRVHRLPSPSWATNR